MFVRRAQRPNHVKCSVAKRKVYLVRESEFEVRAEICGAPDLLADYELPQILIVVGNCIKIYLCVPRPWRVLDLSRGGYGKTDGNSDVFGDLNQGGFTDLTFAGHHLDASPWFPESAGELGGLRSAKTI